MSRPLRLAAIVATDVVSGPTRQLAALAQHLRGLGADVLAVVLQRPGRPAPASAGHLEQARVPYEVVPDRHPLDVGLVRVVDAIFRRWRPTVVQTHGFKATAVAYALRRRGAAWPWIGCFHGVTTENLKVRFYHRLDHWMLRRADRIVVMTNEQAAQFAACGSRVRVIHNAVIPVPSNGDPAGAAAITTLQGSLAAPVLGVVGRLSREKGVDIFLEACALLARRGTSFSAVVAGDGPERQRLERQRERLGLAQRVHFLGHVATIGTLYERLDILVIPSRSEGLPNALLEAVAAGVSVVGTRVGAIPDVLEGLEGGAGGAGGAVVPAGSPEALAAAVERVWGMRTSRPGNGSGNGQRAVFERFSLDRRVAAHVALYRELMA